MQQPANPAPEEIREISELIASAHNVGGQAVAFSLERLKACIAIGERLNAWKRQIGHGKWERWMSENFPQLTFRTRRRWQQLATLNSTGKLDLTNARGLRNAYIAAGILPEAEPITKDGKTAEGVSYLIHIARTIAALKGIALDQLSGTDLAMLKERLRPIVTLFYSIDADSVEAS